MTQPLDADETVTIHFNGGTSATAVISPDDFEDETKRRNSISLGTLAAPISTSDEYVESVLSFPPRPGWRWIGDAFVFTQAVAGITYGDES